MVLRDLKRDLGQVEDLPPFPPRPRTPGQAIPALRAHLGLVHPGGLWIGDLPQGGARLPVRAAWPPRPPSPFARNDFGLTNGESEPGGLEELREF